MGDLMGLAKFVGCTTCYGWGRICDRTCPECNGRGKSYKPIEGTVVLTTEEALLARSLLLQAHRPGRCEPGLQELLDKLTGI